MDDQRFLRACQMKEEGKLTEAFDEFIQLAEVTEDPIDRAGTLLYAAKTLKVLGQYQAAKSPLCAARALLVEHASSDAPTDERVGCLELYLDFEDADLCWKLADQAEALAKFDAAFEKYSQRLRQPDFRAMLECIQACRAFILCDLDRWKEAMPILQLAQSFTVYREGIAFYLGHCYLSSHDYDKAEQHLTESIRLGGLPPTLQYRAHCELGMVHFLQQDFPQAKLHLETCAATADKSYLADGVIWKYLEATCRMMRLKDEAEHYARLANRS